MQKYSKQREIIKEIVLSRMDHPTAETIYSNAQKIHPGISLGTVYRNLNRLAKLGEISQIRIGNDARHFDGDTSPHHHFFCDRCGDIKNLPANCVENRVLQSKSITNFDGQIEGCITCFYGKCGNCR